MQQPPPNYYGSPYPPSYPNKQQNYQNNNQNTPYNGNNTPDYPTQGEVPPAPTNFKTIDNDNDDSLIDVNNLPKGKVTVYATFPDSAVWHDRVFKGDLIKNTNEFMTLYDEETKVFTTIVSVYVNFVEYTDKNLLNRMKTQR